MGDIKCRLLENVKKWVGFVCLRTDFYSYFVVDRVIMTFGFLELNLLSLLYYSITR